MDNYSLVSIIIIFFNGEEFLEEAIESIFSQTYANWELLLVDDGSTDGSTEIALRYSKQFPQQIRYLEHDQHQNRGMSATRNLGIRHAKGEYLIFLDSDDVWIPQCLNTLVAIFNHHPEINAAYGNTLYWRSWAQNSEHVAEDNCDHVAELTHHPNTIFSPSQLLTLFINDGATVPCICSLMVKRSLIETIGGFEESFRGLYEDQIFYAKVGLHATTFVTSECLSKYRQHSASCCAISSEINCDQKRLMFLNWLETYLRNQKQTQTDAWKILQAELFSHRHPRLHRLWQFSRNTWYRLKQLKPDLDFNFPFFTKI
jgi:glycosyltransferase involved in cell wall biosynthesis